MQLFDGNVLVRNLVFEFGDPFGIRHGWDLNQARSFVMWKPSIGP
jgi:hypothetical protein